MATLGQILFLDGGIPSRLSATENADISGNLDLSGSLWVKSDLDVSGNADFSGNLTVGGLLDASGAQFSADVSGVNLYLSADLEVAGDMSGNTLHVASQATISGLLDASGAQFSADISGVGAYFSADLEVVGDMSGNTAHIAGALAAGSAQIAGLLDASGALVRNNLDVSGNAAIVGTLVVSQDATFSADVQVNGDLSVNGSIISRQQVDVIIKDSFLDLAFGNSTSGTEFLASQSGGFTVGQARNSAFAMGNVTAFPSATTFTYADAGGSSLLAAGDVVVISGLPSELAENEGYFVVASVSGASFPQTVTIENALQASLPWAQTAFQDGTPSSAGQAYKPNMSVLAIADGSASFKSLAGATWPVGTLVLASYIGASATGATKALFQANGAYIAVGAGSTTLQNAYENGQTITTTAAKGNVTIAGDQELSVTATGGVYIQNALDVSGAANIDGLVTIDDSLVVTGDISGNTLHIAGQATISGLLDASGAQFSADLSGVGAYFSADMEVAGDISGNTLHIAGQTTIGGLLDASGAQFSADVSGVNLYLSADLEVVGDMSGNTLHVASQATISGLLDASGAQFSADISGVGAYFSADMDISGNLAVDGMAQFKEEVGTLATNYTGSTIAAGTICASVGGARGIKPALADDERPAREWRAWAVAVSGIAASATGFVASVPGTYCTVNMAAASTGTAGDPVYLSAAQAGKATLAAPSAAGNCVMQVGYLAADIAAASTAEIVLAPQFMASIPA